MFFVGDQNVKLKRTISVVIGYEHHPSRLPLFKKCLLSLKGYNQLCVVETGLTQVLTKDWFNEILPTTVGLKYLKIFTSTPYNRAWNFNIGVRHLATCELLVLMDADLVVSPDYFQVVRRIVTSDWVGIGWDRLIYLDEKSTKASLKLPGYEIITPSQSQSIRPSKYGAAGGIFVCPRETYLKFDGMDERFYGRTSEDNAFWAKLEALGYKVQTLPGTIYHLYHEMNKLVAPNREQVFEMLVWSKEKWLEEINVNWGNINGFTYRTF